MATLSLPRPSVAFRCRFGPLLRRLLLLGLLMALGLFLAHAPLVLCLALIAGGIGGVWLLRCPTLALYGLAFAVPFGSLAAFPLGGIKIDAAQFLVLAMVAAWGLRSAALRHVRLARGGLGLALLIYVSALLAAFWPATSLTAALKELAKWLGFLAVYLYSANEMTPREARRLVAALLLAGILEGALGIYQFLRQVGPPGFILLGRYMRAYGTFQQPNPFGGYLGLLLPLAYGWVLASAGETWAAWRRRTWGLVAYWLLAVVATSIMGAALVMSWSRGALVGLAAGVALVLLALGRRAWGIVAVLVVVVLLLGPGLLARLPEALVARLGEASGYLGADVQAIEITDENFAVVERMAHWLAAWRMFAQRPWLGVGTGQYAVVYPTVALPRWQDPLGHAHNYYLNVLAEGGLVGLAGYLAVLGAALALVWRGLSRLQGWRRGVALGAWGMLGHLLAHSLFDNLYVHGMYLLVAMLLGLVAALQKHDPVPQATVPDIP